MALSSHMIEELKNAGHYFAAGTVAKQLGGARFYGCHVGMRSTREAAIAEFNRGFDAAPSTVRQCRHCDNPPAPGYGNCLACCEEVGGDY